MSDVAAPGRVSSNDVSLTASHGNARIALALAVVGILLPSVLILAIDRPAGIFGPPEELGVLAIALRAAALAAFRGVWSILAIVLGRRAEGSGDRAAYAARALGWVGLVLTALAVVRLVAYLNGSDASVAVWFIDWTS